MNLDTELVKLRNVKKVDAPPFLLTRIEQRIDSLSSRSVNPRLRFIVLSSLVVLAIVNLLALSSFTAHNSRENSVRTFAIQMNLSSSNDLYE